MLCGLHRPFGWGVKWRSVGTCSEGYSARSAVTVCSQTQPMFGTYLAATTLLTVAGIQSQKSPTTISPAVSMLGSVAGLASTGMLLAGFFILEWWAPIVALVVGAAASVFLPRGLRLFSGPLVVLGALAGLGLAVLALASA